MEERWGSKRAFVVGSLLVTVALGAFAWSATEQELASGSGRNGDWTIVASWRGQYCIQRYGDDSEGGACGLAQPGTLNESVSWAVSRGNAQRTILAGAVPPGTERVQVTPDQGEPVDATLSRVFRMTSFIAEVPVIQAIDDIRALDGDGRVLQVHEHTPLPPPEEGRSSPTTSAPVARP